MSTLVLATMSALDVTPPIGGGPDTGSAAVAHAALCIRHGLERIRVRLGPETAAQVEETLGAAVSLAELRGDLRGWSAGCALAPMDDRKQPLAPTRRTWHLVRMHVLEAMLAVCLHEAECHDLVPLVVEELEAAGQPWRFGVLVARALLTKLASAGGRSGRAYLRFMYRELEAAVDGPAADSLADDNQRALEHVRAQIHHMAEVTWPAGGLPPGHIDALHEQTRTILQLVVCTEATRGAREAPYEG